MKILTETSEGNFLIEMSEKELWNLQSQYTKDFMDHYGLGVSDIQKDVFCTLCNDNPNAHCRHGLSEG